MSRNQDYSKKILRILTESKAVSVSELVGKIGSEAQEMPAKARYAINRSLKGLEESGLIESHFSGQNDYALLTAAGRRKAAINKLDNHTTLLNPNWDGKWRIILLDLPESRKSERESLRYLLKKAGFVCLKNSAWVSPYPFEHMFINIKKDLGLTTELMILVTDSLDSETETYLIKEFIK
jgi:DNA-binding transcriptional regulator PaaX